MIPERQDAIFNALDGTKLQAWLFPAKLTGPAIVMWPVFRCTEEIVRPEFAESFQANGITALLCDPRGTGESEGSPRNEIDPSKQVEDVSDAITFLSSQSMVDPNQIGLWGMSFGAMVVACAAALDKRARFLIMVCPLVRLYDEDKMRTLLREAQKDRESQHGGNKPFEVPLLTTSGLNPGGMVQGSKPNEDLEKIKDKAQGLSTALQSYYRLAMWQPHALIKKFLAPTPVLMIIPDEDLVSAKDEHRTF